MKIYKMTDRITIEFAVSSTESLVIKFSPLSYLQKIEIQDFLLSGHRTSASFHAIRCSVKEIETLFDQDDKEVKLTFENDILDDDSLNMITNMTSDETSHRLQLICLNLLNGVPSEIISPSTGKPLDGIKIINPKKGKK